MTTAFDSGHNPNVLKKWTGLVLTLTWEHYPNPQDFFKSRDLMDIIEADPVLSVEFDRGIGGLTRILSTMASFGYLDRTDAFGGIRWKLSHTVRSAGIKSYQGNLTTAQRLKDEPLLTITVVNHEN